MVLRHLMLYLLNEKSESFKVWLAFSELRDGGRLMMDNRDRLLVSSALRSTIITYILYLRCSVVGFRHKGILRLFSLAFRGIDHVGKLSRAWITELSVQPNVNGNCFLVNLVKPNPLI